MKRIILSLFVLIFIQFGLIAQPLNPEAVQSYVDQYSTIAIETGRDHHIPSSILLAQAMIYTQAGTNHLAQVANNHLAVTCTAGDVGNRYHQDNNTQNVCFRKYDLVKDSYTDYALRIKKNSLYDPLFALSETDYRGWAEGLQRIGHSQRAQYGASLISLIETYHLYRFDKGYEPVVEEMETKTKVEQKQNREGLKNDQGGEAVLPPDFISSKKEEPKEVEMQIQVVIDDELIQEYQLETVDTPSQKPVQAKVYTITDPSDLKEVYYPYSDRKVYSKDGLKFVIAIKGDSFAKISKSVQLPETHLRLYNDIYDYKYQPVEGEVVYIQKKKKKCKVEFHTIEYGESLRYISQLYGIRLEKILDKNESSNIGVGYILCISCKK